MSGKLGDNGEGMVAGRGWPLSSIAPSKLVEVGRLLELRPERCTWSETVLARFWGFSSEEFLVEGCSFSRQCQSGSTAVDGPEGGWVGRDTSMGTWSVAWGVEWRQDEDAGLH